MPLSKRLEEPEVVAAINRLLDRIDALENTVETLNRVVKEGPGFTAMATDIVDETIQRAADSGISVDDRLRNALTLAEKATDKDTVEAMGKAMDFAKEAPGFVAMVADMFDEQVRMAAGSGIDVESRLKGVLQLAVQLTEPKMLSSIQASLEMATEAPGFIAMVTDMFDEQMKGGDIDSRMRGLLALTEKVTDPGAAHALEKVLAPEALQTVGALGEALSEGARQEIDPVGLMGLMKKMRDPDVKRAMGFLLNVAKSLGQGLKK